MNLPLSTASQPPPGGDLHRRAPVLEPGHTYASVTDKIASIVLTQPTPRSWLAGFAVAFSMTVMMLGSISWLLFWGVGVWGVNIPVGWGFDIINFVWWIGIGHAGTLISAILLLLHQQWRTSINRFAEAMTLFAVMCAGLFPLLHTGRPWFAYWLTPYPSTMGTWPQFRSPLIWDVFAVTTYFTVSLLFWYVGLLPDLATLRDRSRTWLGRVGYGILALGWRGSARHWARYDQAYVLLAGLATPLVVSVHTVVSFDFAVSILPGWHTTIFPPYFVAGAIFSGFAMVMTIVIPLRWVYGLQGFVTMRHLENMANVTLATGLIVAYGYGAEAFMAWYSGNAYESFLLSNRLHGPYSALYFCLLLFNILLPQLLWFQRVKRSLLALFGVAMSINVGMWLERFVIIVVSLHRDFLPSSWGMYYPTVWDWTLFLGTIGFFLTMMFLFIRVLPMISIFEMRHLVHETGHANEAAGSNPETRRPPGPEGEELLGEGGRPESGPQGREAAKLQQTAGPEFRAPLAGPGELYGLLAAFERPEELLEGTRRAREAGWRRLDAFAPHPVEGLSEAIGFGSRLLPFTVLAGGAAGCVGGFLMQCWMGAVDYPLNIGGRPLMSWPSFVPVTFECTVLLAALSAVVGMLIYNGLPRLHHPLFGAPAFARASQDRFFLCLQADDPRFEPGAARAFLEGLGASEVTDVPK